MHHWVHCYSGRPCRGIPYHCCLGHWGGGGNGGEISIVTTPEFTPDVTSLCWRIVAPLSLFPICSSFPSAAGNWCQNSEILLALQMIEIAILNGREGIALGTFRTICRTSQRCCVSFQSSFLSVKPVINLKHVGLLCRLFYLCMLVRKICNLWCYLYYASCDAVRTFVPVN